MSLTENDAQLYKAVLDGNMSRAKAALEAGANVDGSRILPCAPILAATIANHVGMVDLLLQQMADPDKPITEELPHPLPSPDHAIAIPGERALHLAARSGNVEIVSLLLKRSRADPNATDHKGCTPLIATCRSSHVYQNVVRLLLKAGADPALVDKNGLTPLHVVAFRGHVDLVDMLYSRAPATLNCFNSTGDTPLFSACFNGHESMVSKLLSLGAKQPAAVNGSDRCPLLIAVSRGFVGVVIVLINEGGIRAVGGRTVLPKALYLSVRISRTMILQLLLMVYGEERKSEWANTQLDGKHLLHYAAAYCCPAAVSILLEAGADETARDSEGHVTLDVIGLCRGRDTIQMDRGEGIAVRRMLQRGPAYRARSWAWPSDAETDGGGSGDGGPATPAANLSCPPSMKTPPGFDVRISRPKEGTNSNVFLRRICRYCAKD